MPGDQIFSGSGANNVFAALNNLVADYSASQLDGNQAATDTASLSSSLNFVSQQRVTIDNSITQLTSASSAVSSQDTQLTAAQTNLMQADVAQVSTQLAMAETQQTALESVIAQLGSGSLFDKLPA
jgi:flagellar hook-associated protein 3 FlgL